MTIDNENYPLSIIHYPILLTHYRNGDPIPNRRELYVRNLTWGNFKEGAYGDYFNDNNYYPPTLYGRLYNWYAVVDQREIAPKGWHVPSNDEFLILINYLGGADVAGGKLKEMGTEHWNTPNYGATNETGFSGLPGGFRSNEDNHWFEGMGLSGNYWSSTEASTNTAWSKSLNYNDTKFWSANPSDKTKGFSIRCIKD